MKNSFVNLLALIMVQGGGALLPLVAFPYLFHILDDTSFSIVVVSEAVSFFILAAVLYSFDVTAVKKLIDYKDDNISKSRLFVNITVSRLLILIFLFLLSFLISTLFYEKYVLSISLWFMFPLGMLLQSNYYHQAEENNLSFSIGVVFSRVISLVLIYFFVRGSDDYIIAISCLGGGFLISGLISVYLISKKLELKLKYVSKKEVVLLLKEGGVLFLGNVSVVLLRSSNILILSIVSSSAAVAVYALSEKIIKSIQALVRPLNQLAFPKVVKNTSSTMKLRSVANVIWVYTYPQLLVIIVFFLLSLCIYYFLLTGGGATEVADVLFIMAAAVLFGVCNYMYGTVGLSCLLLFKYYSKSIFFVGIITVLSSFILSVYFAEKGAAISYVLGEFLLFIAFFARYFKR